MNDKQRHLAWIANRLYLINHAAKAIVAQQPETKTACPSGAARQRLPLFNDNADPASAAPACLEQVKRFRSKSPHMGDVFAWIFSTSPHMFCRCRSPGSGLSDCDGQFSQIHLGSATDRLCAFLFHSMN
ncbi:hypothetical protein N5I28_18890 [Pseudomonas mosselii]|uniref:hypothetical protein n=1 Tax=Pseudomonas mosselii TaxID=78327 RepID=UPI002449FB94|nr:hypothetical protein [Pseudomonas mosselii]MDH1511820.1 hypothetical protein [Pseudomonas mosselii]